MFHIDYIDCENIVNILDIGLFNFRTKDSPKYKYEMIKYADKIFNDYRCIFDTKIIYSSGYSIPDKNEILRQTFIVCKIISNPKLLLSLYTHRSYKDFSEYSALVKYLDKTESYLIDNINKHIKNNCNINYSDISQITIYEYKIIEQYFNDQLRRYKYPVIKKRCDIIREELQRKIMHPKRIFYMLETYYGDDVELMF